MNKEFSTKGILLVAIILIVGAGFYFQSGGFLSGEKADGEKQLEAVLLTQEQDGEPATSAVVKNTSEGVMLLTYAIDSTNHYKFQTIAAKELPAFPEQVVAATGDTGVWIQAGNRWTYYDEKLEEDPTKKRPLDKKPSPYLVPFQSEERGSGFLIITDDGKGNRWTYESERHPEKVYKLSEEALLSVYQDEVEIVR